MGSSVSSSNASDAFKTAEAGNEMRKSEFFDLVEETTGDDVSSSTDISKDGLTKFFDEIGFSNSEAEEMAKNYLDENEDAEWGDLRDTFYDDNGKRLTKDEFREAANDLNDDYGKDSDYESKSDKDDDGEDDDVANDDNEISYKEARNALDEADAGRSMSKDELYDFAGDLTDGEVEDSDDELDTSSLTKILEGLGIDGDAKELAEEYLDENEDATLGDFRREFFDGETSLNRNELRDAGESFTEEYE